MTVLGLPPATLSVFRISVREAVLYSDPQQSSRSPPPFPLHHLSKGRRCESIVSIGYQTTPPHCVSRATAAHRCGAGGEEKRKAAGWKDGLSSPRRDYTLQHPVASTCLWGLKDPLGLPRCSPRYCSAPVGQVEEVRVYVRFLRRRPGCWVRCLCWKGTPMISNCTKTSLAVRVGVNMCYRMGGG